MTAPAAQLSVLLLYQKRWITDNAPVQIAEKSRRIGITWADAARSALEASPADGGRDAWYIGYTHDMAKEYIHDVAHWASHYNLAASAIAEFDHVEHLANGDTLKIGAYQITFDSGKRVVALSSNPANLRGKQGRVIVDEAAFHPDLEALIEAALALTIWGDSVSIISSHNGETNPFNSLVKSIRAGKYPDYSLHRITFDEAVAEGLCKRVFLKAGKDWSPEAEQEWCAQIRRIYKGRDAQELDVVPSKSAGVYWSYALIDSCMFDSPNAIVRLRCDPGFEQQPAAFREAFISVWLTFHIAPILRHLPKDSRHYYGWDFARDGDLSVMTNLSETQNLHHVANLIIEMANVPFRQQEQILNYVVDGLPRFSGGAHDARGNGQYLAEVAMQRYGAALIAEVMLTQTFYRENMPKFKDAMVSGEYLMPRDADVLGDYLLVTVENGVPKVPDDAHTTGRDNQKRHGDAAISGMLANYASRNPGAVIEFESINEAEIGAQFHDYMGPR